MPEGEKIKKELPANYVWPNKPSPCTWKASGNSEPNPHTKRTFKPELHKTYPDILHVIGNTHLVKLNKIPQSEGIKCDMYAKCEFLNPGGSVKDRIGFRMVLDAEEKGILKPGCTIIEPTSGNTGVGLAMACAVKGYKCLIVMPDKMSNEKVATLKALGATIIRTPTEAGFDDPSGLIAEAYRLQAQIKDSIILNQYINPGNPLAHYDGTATEVLWQLDNDIDLFVMGAGTGGTISGVGRKIKEACPKCKIVGADPYSSILAQPPELNITDVVKYEVEGIGYDFIPSVLDLNVVDVWEKTSDKESFLMARRLQKEEGFLCGGSSGAAMVVALKYAKHLKEGQKCVVLLPDNIRNYMTKFVSDNWMEARDFKEVPLDENNHWWWNQKVEKLNSPKPVIISPETKTNEAIKLLKENNLEILMVVDDNGNIIGAVTLENLMPKLVSSNLKYSDEIRSSVYKKYIKVTPDDILGKVGRILEVETFVVLVDDGQIQTPKLTGVVTRMDFLKYITSKESQTNGA
ncbi:cystathionine beta-synthase [Condylostylus longicornis]|uniref:cystathionine beta-synthase n=1 Tax=Condylostylus longicornis TaxID=2530218 RepID=UPI00244DB19C|nr:cystathionine beta-synthase [Condylostylus longicornis]